MDWELYLILSVQAPGGIYGALVPAPALPVVPGNLTTESLPLFFSSSCGSGAGSDYGLRSARSGAWVLLRVLLLYNEAEGCVVWDQLRPTSAQLLGLLYLLLLAS